MKIKAVTEHELAYNYHKLAAKFVTTSAVSGLKSDERLHTPTQKFECLYKNDK